MKNPARIALGLFVLACLGGIVAAQQPAAPAASPKPAPGPAAALLGAWNYEGGKLLAMANDFPENLYDFKPNPAQRSFAEQLLHVAGDHYAFINATQGKSTGDESFPRERYKTKADVVAVLKKSIDDGTAAIKSKGDTGLNDDIRSPWGNYMIRLYDFGYSVITHSAEHYGQLVVYYRVNNMVPPDSRPR